VECDVSVSVPEQYLPGFQLQPSRSQPPAERVFQVVDAQISESLGDVFIVGQGARFRGLDSRTFLRAVICLF
jgi:hypothetical protein